MNFTDEKKKNKRRLSLFFTNRVTRISEKKTCGKRSPYKITINIGRRKSDYKRNLVNHTATSYKTAFRFHRDGRCLGTIKTLFSSRHTGAALIRSRISSVAYFRESEHSTHLCGKVSKSHRTRVALTVDRPTL